MVSRLAKHKELGTWHYDLTRKDDIDYDDLGQIHASDQFWADGIDELLMMPDVKGMDYSIDAVMDIGNTTDSDHPYNVARRSLVVDMLNWNINLKDRWFNRFSLPNTHRFYQIPASLGLDGMCITGARMFEQQPLEGTPLHIDHEHQLLYGPGSSADDYNTVDEVFESRKDFRKIIVTLQHSEPGMIFYFGNTSVSNWAPGKLISMPYGMPHWMVNLSNKPRYTLVISGSMPDLVVPYKKDYTIG